MESYSVAADVNGLNGGPSWFGPYVDNYPYFGLGYRRRYGELHGQRRPRRA